MTEKKTPAHKPAAHKPAKPSAVQDLPTSDDTAPPSIDTTPAVKTKKKVFVVWDAFNHVVTAGPFETVEEAQIAVDTTAARDSKAAGYVGSSLSIEQVSDGRS